MRNRRSARLLAAAVLALSAVGLIGCTPADRGGADTIPSAAATDATFTPLAQAVTAPAVDGTLIDGTPVSLPALWADRVIVLQFLSTWCTQCVAAEPDLAKIQEEYGDAALVVRIAFDEPEDTIRSYLNDNDVNGPVIVDSNGSIRRAFTATEPPLTAVIDTEGGIVSMWPGGAEPDQVREALDEVVTVG